jgi:hypothetical protein
LAWQVTDNNNDREDNDMRIHLHKFLFLLALALVQIATPAQVHPDADSFFLSRTTRGLNPGYIASIDPNNQLVLGYLGSGFESKIQASGAGDGLIYYNVLTPSYHKQPMEWPYRAGQEYPIVTHPQRELPGWWGVIDEDYVYFTVSSGHPRWGIGRILRSQTSTVQIPELVVDLGTWSPYINDATWNGRDMIFATDTGIYVVDTEVPGPPRLIDPLYTKAVAMGRDGWVMIGRWESPFPNGIRMIHPRTGATRLHVNGPPGSTGLISDRFAYNPWTDEFLRGGYGIAWGLASDRSTWNSFTWNPFDPVGMPYVSSNAERPFLLRGKGCLNGLGKEPRLGWQGLPLRGQSYDITLTDAEPNTMMAFWFGYSRTWSPTFGSLPFDAGIFGAPGCRILASPDVCLLAPVDAQGNGAITLPVPMSPAIAGLKLFGQTGSFSTANPLGVATSESVIMRYR